jgi:hypothetical protein
MRTGTYLSAAGDLVPWDDLDDAERSYHSTPAPWVVTEYGMTLAEYVLKWHADAALHELYFDDDSLVPDAV